MSRPMNSISIGGPFDPLESPPPTAGPDSVQPESPGRENGKKKEPLPPYQLLDVRGLLSYQEKPGAMLCGDAVLELGEFAMLYGTPSVGKSWAILDLMVKAARGEGRWLGHEIQCPFATLWIGDENNQRRLATQLKAMSAEGLLQERFEDSIFITDVPETMDLGAPAFREHTRRLVEEKGIKLVILDTVTSAVEDETAKDFATMFRGMKAISHGLPVRPCWLLVHHRRKPKNDDSDGLGRLHQISGHQTLRRKPRTIIELERVTQEPGDRRVVATLLKNSNGKSEGTKQALQQTDSGFSEILDFDFSVLGSNAGAGGHNEKISERHIRELFDEGRASYQRSEAVQKLMQITGAKDKACYAALGRNGRFAKILLFEQDNIQLAIDGAKDVQ
jgi:hypothetical protein